MSGSRWTHNLWPGLPTLWRGDWSGFAPALAFTLLLNAALLSTFVWTEIVAPGVRFGAWGVVAFAVLGSCWTSRRAARGPQRGDFAGQGDLFPAALCEYLKGNWVETERLLERALLQQADDLEARLLLATVWRRTRRLDEARAALEELCELDGAVKWISEIRQELQLLEEAAAAQDSSTNVDDSQALPQAA